MTYTWSFDEPTLHASAAPVLGDWQLEDGTIVQRARTASGDFPRILIEDLQFTDLELSVRCRAEDGTIDRACGILFRAADSDNYYITRANVLEDNVRLYHVIDGVRQQLASADAAVENFRWHTLGVTAIGSTLSVTWDSVELISFTDATFTRGAIGIWTKADSVTRFDDLVAVAR